MSPPDYDRVVFEIRQQAQDALGEEHKSARASPRSQWFPRSSYGSRWTMDEDQRAGTAATPGPAVAGTVFSLMGGFQIFGIFGFRKFARGISKAKKSTKF